MYIGNRWLEDTNGDGSLNDEAGAMYSGTITNQASNLNINLNGTTSAAQITLADLGLDMLDEVVIQDNKVISIKKNGNTTNASNGTGSGSTGGTTGRYQ